MSADIFNVGLVGAGTIAHSHAKAFNSLPDARVLAVCEIIDDRLEPFAKKYNIEIAVKNYEELLEIDELDALVLCLPNYLHAPVAVAGMKAGKHVLTEKPMAINGRAAEEMVEVQKETGKTLMVSLQARYTKDIQIARKYARDHFGEIYYGRCGYLRQSGIPGWGSWFTQKEKAGGGPCADIGVHVLDQCLYIMGYPRPVSVTGSTYAKFGPDGRGKGGWAEPDPQGYFDVEDLASAFIRFENGATVLMEASWALNRHSERWVEVMGTEGGAVYDGGLKIHTQHYDTPVEIDPQGSDDGGRMAMTRHFLECCRTGKEPDTSPDCGLILNTIFDAVYKSGKEGGKQIEINL